MSERGVATQTELRQVLAELEMCSHVSAVNLNPSTRDVSDGDDIGGNRPPGGVDGREDRHRTLRGDEGERVLRSAQHFRRQLERGRSRARVLEEARAALAAFKRQPPPGDWPEYGTPQWKRWVSESALTCGEVARVYNVTSRYVRQVRAQYRAAA